jgi:hypothetical protein
VVTDGTAPAEITSSCSAQTTAAALGITDDNSQTIAWGRWESPSITGTIGWAANLVGVYIPAPGSRTFTLTMYNKNTAGGPSVTFVGVTLFAVEL